MADQLLSQADVDALVASLTQNASAKPATPPPQKSVAASAPVSAGNKAPVFNTTASIPKPTAMPVTQVKAGSKNVAPVNAAGAAPKPSVAQKTGKPGVPAGNTGGVSVETVNNLSSKIADLTKQLGQIEHAVQKLDSLEKRITALEAKAARNTESPITTRKVQILTDELQKISTKLKGTPGYGVKDSFTCDHCDDHGHVAVMYRCTKCGHERWYGWWPEKRRKA
jgi:hypothetical protein